MELGHSAGKRISFRPYLQQNNCCPPLPLSRTVSQPGDMGGEPCSLMPISPSPLASWGGGGRGRKLPPVLFFSKHEAKVLNLACSELQVQRWIESLDGSAQRKAAHDYIPGFTEQPVPFSQGGMAAAAGSPQEGQAWPGLQFNELSAETLSRLLLSSVAGRPAPVPSAFEIDGKVPAKSSCICAFNTIGICPCFWTKDKMGFGCLF